MLKPAEIRPHWNKKAATTLVHRRIIEARYLTAAEAAEAGWDRCPLALVLDDGTTLYASSDDEGNDAGALHGCGPKGQFVCFPVLSAND